MSISDARNAKHCEANIRKISVMIGAWIAIIIGVVTALILAFYGVFSSPNEPDA
jgi:hypothetical protein